MGNYPAQITHTGEEVKGLRSVRGGRRAEVEGREEEDDRVGR